MYLHFSAPMSQGASYRHLHLHDEAGQAVEGAFLELPQELWNAEGTRLTLLLDPGRVKTGLVPREELGSILQAGRRYTFTVDGDWPDAEGRPLVASITKTFRIAQADTSQPDPRRWTIGPPRAGTRDALTVTFPEPLDHAMLFRALRVTGPRGLGSEAVKAAVSGPPGAAARDVAGAIEVDSGERRWRFTPQHDWQSGQYVLVISPELEDPSGNSVGRPFEVDLRRKQPAAAPVLFREFSISSGTAAAR
jgi:hypothetical protein